MGPKAREGPGLLSQQSQDSSSGPLPPCQHDCARHEPQGRGRPALPLHLAFGQPCLARSTLSMSPCIPGLLGSGLGPPPGHCQPGLAGPRGASFHLGKSQLPQPPAHGGPDDPQAPLLFLAGGSAGLSSSAIARETEQLRPLAPRSFPAHETVNTLLNHRCASAFSSAKWGY